MMSSVSLDCDEVAVTIVARDQLLEFVLLLRHLLDLRLWTMHLMFTTGFRKGSNFLNG